jgi:enamine deaminase RidA (YjgF/YER057c/UK114 family)
MSGQVPWVSEVVGTDGSVRMSPQAMEHLRAAIKEKDSLLACRVEDEGLSHLVRLLEQLGAVGESMSSS